MSDNKTKNNRLGISFETLRLLNSLAVCEPPSNFRFMPPVSSDVWLLIFERLLSRCCQEATPQHLQRLRQVCRFWLELIDSVIAANAGIWLPAVAMATMPKPDDCCKSSSVVNYCSYGFSELKTCEMALARHRLAKCGRPVAMATRPGIYRLTVPGLHQPITGLELLGADQVVLAACLENYRGRIFAAASVDVGDTESGVELFDVAAMSRGCRTRLTPQARTIRLDYRQYLLITMEAYPTYSILDIFRLRLSGDPASIQLTRNLGCVVRAWDLVDKDRLVACPADSNTLICYRLVYGSNTENEPVVVDLELSWHTVIAGVYLPPGPESNSDAVKWRLIASSSLVALLTEDLQLRVWRLRPGDPGDTRAAVLSPRFGAALAKLHEKSPRMRVLSACLASPHCLLLVPDWRKTALLAIDLSTDTNGDVSCRELPIGGLSDGEFCTSVAVEGDCGCGLIALGFSSGRLRVYSVWKTSSSKLTDASDIASALLLGNSTASSAALSQIVATFAMDVPQPVSLISLDLTPDLDAKFGDPELKGILSLAACTAGSSACQLFRRRLEIN